MPAVIPAQVEARPSQALPAREDKKAGLWGGKHMGWVDSPCTGCEFCHFTARRRQKEGERDSCDVKGCDSLIHA